MKHSSKKLLLWLYPETAAQKRRVSIDQLDWVLAELTPAGRLSLVRHLVRQQLVFIDQVQGFVSLSLSSHGKLQLEADFPALTVSWSEWKGKWQLIVFTKAPSTDKNFRYLRTILLQTHCFPLNRGVYLYPGDLPTKLIELLHQIYREKVVVAECTNWRFGDDLIFIGQNPQVKGLSEVYSGISKEVEELLIKKSKINRLSDRQKMTLASIFDRFVTVLSDDIGLVSLYYPNSPNGKTILNSIKSNYPSGFSLLK
ncbi:MAG TPA: hypothetical protein PLM16_02485 [Candidatus Woesebacteria bacterium]|nr:hypothetical protein [Candidatus Woesebacteria bacterium]